MDLINGSACDCSGFQALDKTGQLWLVVVAKQTYQIPPQEDLPCQRAAMQRGLLVCDVFAGEPGVGAALLESDLAPGKAACDVIVKGSAHAPAGRPVAQLQVALRVGPIAKALRVTGDRHWHRQPDGQYLADPPLPFLTMPISYERASGCCWQRTGVNHAREFLVHPANPVGRGYAHGVFLQWMDGAALPNLEAADERITAPDQVVTPVSLGPIGRGWQPRLAFAGTYDQRWRDTVFPLLPPDFDERFYQCAPADQQMPYPLGGELVTLVNLLPGGGTQRFRLPALALPMLAVPRAGEPLPLQAAVDTLVIDTDQRSVDVVWRARMPLGRSLHEIHVVAIGSACERWEPGDAYREGVRNDSNPGLPLGEPVTEGSDDD